MKTCVFLDEGSGRTVAFSTASIDRMLRLASVSPCTETGGILIGGYFDDGLTAEIMEATGPPRGSLFCSDRFQRSNVGLKELLVRRWAKEPRSYYLGEWHSHVVNVGEPSPQDRRQMIEIARDGQYRCIAPLLVIVHPTKTGEWELKCYLFKREGQMSVLRRIRSGPTRFQLS